MRVASLRGPLEETHFRNLFFARAFSMLGDAIVPVALAFAVLDIKRSSSAELIGTGPTLAISQCGRSSRRSSC